MRWSKLPIRTKFTLLTMSICIVALMLSSVGVIAWARINTRNQLTQQLQVIGDLVGTSSIAAIESGDGEAAARLLAALRSEPLVESATITLPDGTRLADYRGNPVPGSDASSLPGLSDLGGSIDVVRPIFVDGRSVASIEIQGSLRSVQEQIRQYIQLVSVVIAISAIAALLLAVRLQRVISGPIFRLAHTARRISTIGDYRVRAEKETGDELGELVDQFNEMLSQIERRDAELIKTRDQLEDRVRERTKELEAEVAERRRTEEQLILAKAAAEEANIAKSTFLANMSHELRTPLNAVLGYSEMLREDAVDGGDEQLVKDIDQIIIAGRHLLSLINAVLDLSKIEAGKMQFEVETFDLAQFVNDIVELTTPLAKKRQNEFLVGPLDHLGQMISDRTKVQQILINLLGNACKFTKGGRIRFDVLRGGDLVDEVSFRIEDTGIGISKEQQAQLFRDFSRADDYEARQNEGTGLGLAISQRLCRLLGGRIEMKSELGVGSTFTLILPCQLEVPASAQVEGKSQPAGQVDSDPGDTRPVVLVIDDDASARDLAGRIIGRAGFRSMEAPNAEDGLQLLKAFPPAAVLLDVILPDVDGWTLLRRIRKIPELAKLPVIITSVTDDRRRSMSLGAIDHMTKPFDALRLIQTLRKAVGQGKRPAGAEPVGAGSPGQAAAERLNL